MILNGDVRKVLETIEPHSIQTCITSPPYWNLRDYDNDNQIGMEDTPEEFANTLVKVFSGLKRVLRKDGTFWLNLGDTYFGAKGGHWDGGNSVTNDETGSNYRIHKKAPPKHKYLKTKDLVGIPWMVAMRMQKDGWFLRNDIIWHKPNPMPEAVKDRCVKSHEHMFLFAHPESKGKYYFNYKAIQEPSINEENEMKNKKDVWTVNTSSFGGAHFAVFPRKLIAPCIKASTREGDIVLDTFAGSGTTCRLAQELGRKWIGIELNPEYAQIIKDQTQQQSLF